MSIFCNSEIGSLQIVNTQHHNAEINQFSLRRDEDVNDELRIGSQIVEPTLKTIIILHSNLLLRIRSVLFCITCPPFQAKQL